MGNKSMWKFILGVAITLIFLAACDNPTLKDYEKVHMGMKYKEVEQILGKPSSCSDAMGIKECIWGNNKSYIKVDFVANVVTIFSSKNIR